MNYDNPRIADVAESLKARLETLEVKADILKAVELRALYAEMNNVFDQTQREITSRYDFKGTPAELEWLNGDKTGLKITGNGEWQIDAILDIIRKKLATRGQSQKVLDTTKDVTESNLKTTKEVPLKQGLDQEKAKQITKLLRDEFPKVKAQIQGDAVRVMSNSKDDLQAVMQLLKSKDFDFPLSFNNYR